MGVRVVEERMALQRSWFKPKSRHYYILSNWQRMVILEVTVLSNRPDQNRIFRRSKCLFIL